MWKVRYKTYSYYVPCRYYSRAVAVVILYDITKHTTFQDVSQRWLKELEDSTNLQSPVLMLIGHKYDLRHVRSVTVDEGETLAGKYHDCIALVGTYMYMPVSVWQL